MGGALACVVVALTGCLSALPEGTSFADSDAGFTPATHAPWPVLQQLDGGPIANPRLVGIAFAGDPQISDYQSFVEELVTSPWLQQVGAEYGVGAATLGGSFTLNPSLAPSLDGGFDQAGTAAVIDAAVAAGAPPPNGQTIYVVFAPPGAIDSADPTKVDIFWPYSGAHGAGQGDQMLTLYPIAPGTTSTTLLQNITMFGSRGVFDAATSAAWGIVAASPPWEGTPAIPDFPTTWAGQLADDTCVAEDGFVFQRIWSNAQAAKGADPMLPAIEQPFYVASFAQQWVAVSAGQAASIPFTGWSTAAIADWFLEPEVSIVTGGFADLATPTAASALGEAQQSSACPLLPALNNGVTGTLQVSVPSGAASGDYAVVALRSLYFDASTCLDLPPTQGDIKHWSWVGVYVP